MLRTLVEKNHLGAMTGQGWYRFHDAPDAVVQERDRQLTDLLAWLRDRDPVGGFRLD